MATRSVLAIVGSYREDGITARLVAEVLAECRERGCETHTIDLREAAIGFCSNCRVCTQEAGEAPGQCTMQDDMAVIIAHIEAADGLVLAAPTNFFQLTALFKRFQERLICYAHWPWGARMGPALRRRRRAKAAVLISSCGAPALAGRFLFGSLRGLGLTAKILGAKVVGRQLTGLVGVEAQEALSPAARRTARKLGRRLHRHLATH